MPAISARPNRVAILAVTGATALSLAACSSSSNPPSATSSAGTTAASSGTTATTSAPPSGESHVSGMIASVSGNSAQVTQKSGNATVNFTGSTKVTEVSTAALTDVTPGSCVSIRSAHGSHGGKPITAATVRVSQAVDGKCPTGKESAPDSTTTAPSSPSPTPSPSTPSGKKPDVAGSVASVSGNTINVTSTDANGNPSQTAVAVDDKTKYTKRAPADTQAITQGKCMTAKGTKDSGGALQATTINLRPANNGKCGRD
ncbi:DUF5666 domain-containing protein [Mycobacterium sp. 852002-51163_SCH5372311]|uniref:DUF5666 domain-containing protein n=1 Tax=Mycobacterium sp. 852002-51163_SCH5372311 TaxID=1834097 RepID=UPI000B310F19|nr:DUF5666 domain-containing protein [Mycobacterium sp. 852002-51163_SCH5372311]